MNKQLQALKDWMDSPEFDEHLIKFGEKMKIEEARRERYIQWIHDHYKDRLDEIIEKLCNKYDSDEYGFQRNCMSSSIVPQLPMMLIHQ